MKQQIEKERRFHLTATVVGLGVWTLLVAGSLAWNITQQYRVTLEMAAKEARSYYNKDDAFRQWASSHGGVYVPTNERTPPNPNLSYVYERDITTPGGQELTLMNPAYVLRQLFGEYEEQYGIRGKITAFPGQLVNPANMPDDWEIYALQAFASGEKEVSEVAELSGAPYLRLMQPMFMKPSCLKCHAEQGYTVGQLRGGVGVSIPMKPYLDLEQSRVNNLAMTHTLIWLIGASFGLFTSRRILTNLTERHESQYQLHRAKELAEAANKHKSMFLAHMSHELRTPLNAIIGFSEMMSQRIYGELNPKYVEYADLIDISGQHLLETINQILDLSKIEADMMALEEQSIYMGTLVDEVFDLLKYTAESKSVTLINKTQNLHTMYVDPLRIKQTLFNIIGNAIKFTDHGEITVYNRCDEKGHRIIIQDTGVGMTAEELKLAMKPFSQAHNQIYTRKIQGTGLGLSLSEHIMSMHNGELIVTSTKGVGTEVILFFPNSREMQSHAHEGDEAGEVQPS